jgi:AcrR family transcriptional regulator
MAVAVITYDQAMARWQPNARGRLAEAALALYAERGFDNTTVGEIAERAGLTERTFFRYFADKREVLFGGAAELQEVLVSAVANAPANAAPIDAVAAGLCAWADALQGRRAWARQRQAVITGNAELRERELIKLASFGAAIAEALRARGVPDAAASLTAEAGMAVFHVAFQRWTSAANAPDLWALILETFEDLKTVTSPGSSRRGTGAKRVAAS